MGDGRHNKLIKNLGFKSWLTMFDINFYMQSHALIKEIDNGKEFSKLELYSYFEKIRSKDPIVYNIETTNACNMRCKMCPAQVG